MLDQLKKMSDKDRLDYLNTHADHVEESEYFQSFGDDEMAQTQADLSDAAMALDSKKEELDAIKATFKAAMDELKKNYKLALTNLKQQGERVKGKLFLFADQEARMMNYYDQHGQLVRSRRLKPEERQMGVLSINRTA